MVRIDRLSIESITIDPDLQPRRGGLDDDHIRALMETPESWPPIVVVSCEGQQVLVDGAHRLAAALRLGVTEITAEIRDDDGSDLRRMAFDLNSLHGRALSLRDKRGHAEYLLRQGVFTSNQALAQLAGLSATTVQSIRARLENVAAIEETRYEPQSGSRVSSRHAGELPEAGLLQVTGDALRSFLEPPTRGRHRRAARYLERLATSTAERAAPLEGLSPHERAQALVVTFGEARARAIVQELVEVASELTEIANAFKGRAA